jgi:hypothetical protein
MVPMNLGSVYFVTDKMQMTFIEELMSVFCIFQSL